jgi:hypothetical protein
MHENISTSKLILLLNEQIVFQGSKVCDLEKVWERVVTLFLVFLYACIYVTDRQPLSLIIIIVIIYSVG